MRSGLLGLAGAAVAVLASMSALGNPPARGRVVVTGLAQPVSIAHAAGQANHLFVCERAGQIRVVDVVAGTLLAQPFLDIRPLVTSLGDGGLLGLAFAPDFLSSGHFYVFYNAITTNDRVLARYHAAPGSLVADADSGFIVWQYPRSVGHNGGWIDFSPVNGYLYLSSGDGGTGFSFDAPNRAQTITNQLMGKMLRIDVGGDDFPADPDRNYRIPPSNPFVGAEGDDEIWSYGLRNPWRCSFDRLTGDLWIADVGQDLWEEINVEPPTSAGGRNYGWRCMEANHCTGLGGCSCTDLGLTPPVFEYDHTLGHSVTGGYVYRGSAILALHGAYFYADFQDDRIWTFRLVAGSVTEWQERTQELRPPNAAGPIAKVSAFGEDTSGELYIADVMSGTLYRVDPWPCPPAIDREPMPTSAIAGQSATLTVAAAGTDPLVFQWRRADEPLSDGPRIIGSETDTLTILQTEPGDAGAYDVVITDPCGSTASASVQLTVVESCPADFNGVGGLSVQDIFDFLAAFFAGDVRADFNDSGSLSVQDIFDFLAAYFAGC